jgi:hypothetical protein
MVKTRKHKKGEKLYRFRINLTDGTVSKDIYEILETVGVATKVVLRSHEGKEPPKDVFAYYSLEDSLAAIKTKATVKYVLLDKDDEAEAVRLVLGYLEKKLEEKEKEAVKLNDWVLTARTALFRACCGKEEK